MAWDLEEIKLMAVLIDNGFIFEVAPGSGNVDPDEPCTLWQRGWFPGKSPFPGRFRGRVIVKEGCTVREAVNLAAGELVVDALAKLGGSTDA